MAYMKPLPPILNGVKIIKDLGVNYLNEKSRTKTRNAIVECPDCREQRAINIYVVRAGQSKGHCPSCSNKGTMNGGYKHGDNSTTNRTKAHSIWNSMKNRCLNPSNKDYASYGGRGIRVCKEWMDYINFKKWEDGRLVGDMSIERIDTNGDYTPENCIIIPKWAQSYNRRNSVPGGLLTYIEIAKDLENIPPYYGKGKFIAKKYNCDRMAITHLAQNKNKRERLIKLNQDNPNWLQELKGKINDLDS